MRTNFEGIMTTIIFARAFTRERVLKTALKKITKLKVEAIFAIATQ